MFRFAVRSISRTISAVSGAACVAAMLFATSSAQGQGLYKSPSPTLTVGTTPQGVAAADFALSGYQSLVVTDSASKNMKVFLATGPGTFASAFTYATCTGPKAVVASDINDDGYPDIVVACPSSNTFDVFANNGVSSPGTFAAAVPITVTDPVAFAIGDFLGTGTVDAAVASGTGGVTIFLNVSGTLMTHTVALTGTLSGITTGDFNHDGHLDLAVSDSASNNVHILFGDGTGNFTLSSSYGAGTNPSAIATADFNNDGNLDLAVTNAGSNNVTILSGSAAGTFTTASTTSAGANPIAISVTDVNSDGNPDVIAYDSVTASTGAVSILLGNGDGTLQNAQSATLSSVPGTIAAVADFNRDGKPDVAITQQTANTASLLLNNTLPTQYPDGRSFSAASTLTNGKGNMADSVAVGDFNKDGYPDIAVAYLEDNAVRVLLNNGGGFGTAAVYATGKQPYNVSAGDLNGDGYADLVTANTTDGTISVLLNNGKTGNGTFAATATYTVGKQPFQVAIGDVNGDNIPDLAVTNYGGNSVTVLLGHAGGTFTTGSTLTMGAGCSPYGAAIGDFSHNGFPDIAVTCNQTSQLYVFPNNGNGTFGTPFITATGTAPASLVVGDFNRDGKLDIVTGNTTANDISFFAGNGNGTFAAGVAGPSLNFPASIVAGDFNGDGILDIAGVAPNFNAVEVTLGVGDGTFGTFQQRAAGQFAAAKQPWGIAAGDFNNDGTLDLVTANTFSQINIASPVYQARYMAEYPAIPAGNPSIDILSNTSGASISESASPASPLPYNNTGTMVTTAVQPALSGPTPTGSVIFEDSTGAPIGSGPYTLSGGAVSLATGRLGSGQYQFTTLYSGDSNFQPTTLSGSAVTVIVSGTPVALSVSPASVSYANTFTVSVSVTGSSPIPQGTVTVYGVNGASTFTLGTITLNAAGSGTGTYTAVGPNLNVGTYQIYGYYTSTNGYPAGSSPNANLTVTAEPTSLALSCSGGFFGDSCTATVTASTTHTPVPAGNVVNFSVNGGTPVTQTIGAGGTAAYSFSAIFGSFTVSATFPQQSNYLSSTNTTTVICFIFCGLDRTNPVTPLNSFSGLGANLTFYGPAINSRRNAPFQLF